MSDHKARVEPRRNEPGCWNFFCECGYENWRVGCSRVVNDSEPNFSCERPIEEATDVKCPLRWKLAPLIKEYEEKAEKEEAAKILFTLEARRKYAMRVLGITEEDIERTKKEIKE